MSLEFRPQFQVNALIPKHKVALRDQLFILDDHPSNAEQIVVTKDGRYLISLSTVLLVWDLKSPTIPLNGPVPSNPSHGANFRGLSLSPDDKHIIFCSTKTLYIVSGFRRRNNQSVHVKKSCQINMISESYASEFAVILWDGQCGKWCMYGYDGVWIRSGSSDSLRSYYNWSLIKAIPHHAHKPTLLWQEKYRKVLSLDKGSREIQLPDYALYHVSSNLDLLLICEKTKVGIGITIFKYDKKTQDWADNPKTMPKKGVDEVIALGLTTNEEFAVLCHKTSYGVLPLSESARSDLGATFKAFLLPKGVRNDPKGTDLVLTKNNETAIAAIGKHFYIWDVQCETLINQIDAHYDILCWKIIETEESNSIVASTEHHLISLWNLDTALHKNVEDKGAAVQSLLVTEDAKSAVVTTRSGIELWDIEEGRLLKTLPDSSHVNR